MINFIELTNEDGFKVTLNAFYIIAILENYDKKTKVVTIGGSESCFKETVDEIKMLCNKDK